MRYYLITVGDKYVSHHLDFLTDDKSRAGVFNDNNIDAAFGLWDKETDGGADIVEIDWE